MNKMKVKYEAGIQGQNRTRNSHYGSVVNVVKHNLQKALFHWW